MRLGYRYFNTKIATNINCSSKILVIPHLTQSLWCDVKSVKCHRVWDFKSQHSHNRTKEHTIDERCHYGGKLFD